MRAAVAVSLFSLVGATAHAQSAADLAAPTFDSDIAGELTADDATGERGFEDRFALSGAAGVTVEVDLRSDVFDTYLMLEDAAGNVIQSDDDGGDGTNSRMRARLPDNDAYTVVVTSYSEASEGPYTLRLSEYVPTPLSVGAIGFGDAVVGSIDSSDGTLADGARADAYRIDLDLGQAVRIELNSDTFDTYLYLVGPTGERVREDDDGAGYGTDSRIDWVASAEGTYTVIVSSFGGSGSGAYTLTAGAPGVAVANTRATPLALGVMSTGTLAEGDEAADRGGFQDRYTVDVSAGEQLQVTLRSDAFDTYLTLLSPEGYEVAYDDDSAGDLDSAIFHVASDSGTYTILAQSYGGGLGNYTIDAAVSEPAPVVVTPIAFGETVSGELGVGDARSLAGGFVDLYAFEAEAGDRVDIDLGYESQAGAELIAPTGETFGYEAANVYGPGFAGVHIPFDGTYLIRVQAWGSQQVSYELTVRPAGASGPVHASPIEAGDVVSGTLGEGDMRRADGLADAYLLTVTEPGSFRIAATSPTADTVLELLDADEQMVAMNDDAEGLNPALRTFLAPGEYRIILREYTAAGGGAYELSVTETPSVPVVVSEVGVGDSIVGRIDDNDAISVVRSNPADFYRMEVGAGQTVSVSMTSEAIDPYLIIVDATGAVLTQDDDSGGDFDALATFTPEVSGIVTIIATGYDQRQGDYQLFLVEGTLTGPVGPEL